MSLNRDYLNQRIEQSTKEIIKGLEGVTLEFKWGRIAPSPSPLRIDVTRLPLKKISQDNLLLEASQNYRKKPVKEYTNMLEDNEIKLLRLPAELWLHIYTFLDTPSLVVLTSACKTWGMIANDISIRARLYEAHESQKQTVLYKCLV